MKTNFKKSFLFLDGQELKDATGEVVLINKSLAMILSNATKGNAIKFYDWAKELFVSGELNLSRSDRQEILDYVKPLEYEAMMKAQILEILETDKKDE